MKKRKAGVLFPISSLPGKYGIGSFSKHAFEFVDKLAEAGQKYWQILPLGPTSYGDSPYQSFCAFAGNIYFIDLEQLVEDGLLKKSELEDVDFGNNENAIDYEKLFYNRYKVLRLAYKRAKIKKNPDFKQFLKANKYWIEDYSLFMALKDAYKGMSYFEWDEPLRMREKRAIKFAREKYDEDVVFYQYLQYLFVCQWTKLKTYANNKGIKIIGDIPIYVALDSSDTWAHPEMFQFDEKGNPVAVAGCPPDAFCATGQLWGNPLYDWGFHKRTGFKWWIKRMEHTFSLYDVVRIDHFRGFDEYYSIPYGDHTAEFGHWEKGPGYKLFKTLKNTLGDMNIIVEDLGFLTESVIKLVKKTGYPNMKVLQFAFDSKEESEYLPHNYDRNCVVYTGTHDNNTLQAWMDEISDEDRTFAERYANISGKDRKEMHWDYIKLAMGSVANLCVIPMQDYLGLGKEARINMPSTLGNNWIWRMSEGAFTEELAEKIHTITKDYGRL